MCGIVMVLSNEVRKGDIDRRRFAANALYADGVRGLDGTGMFGVKGAKPTDVDICKKAMPVHDFLDLGIADKMLFNIHNYKYWVGHNRKSTMGANTAKNSHPFSHGHITMVHNGTISNKDAVSNGVVFPIDSEAICYSLAVNGALETVEKIKGAFALVWHDARDNTLNVVRNDDRPFAFGTVKGEETILGASEYGMLEWLADRHGMPLDTLWELDTGYIVTFDEDLKGYSTTPVKYAPKPVYANGYWQGGVFHQYPVKKEEKKGVEILTNLKDERIEKTKRLLLQHGLKLGDTIEFETVEFVPYNKRDPDTRGKVIGLPLDHETFLVETHGICEKYLGDKDTIYSGTVLGLRNDPSNGNSTNVVVGDVDVVEVEEVLPDTDELAEAEVQADANFFPDKPEKDVIGPTGQLITRKEWDRLTKHGCQQCGDNLWSHAAQSIFWMNGYTPICDNCVEEDLNSSKLH